MKAKRSIPKELRYTLRDFNAEFPDDDACLEYIKEQRWPRGITQCAKCGRERKHYRVTGRTAYACDHCGNHIYPLTGTVFEKSTTSLRDSCKPPAGPIFSNPLFSTRKKMRKTRNRSHCFVLHMDYQAELGPCVHGRPSTLNSQLPTALPSCPLARRFHLWASGRRSP
jgi:transposase-like zinc ribbon protein